MTRRPSYMQSSFWLANKLDANCSSYNIAFATHMFGDLDTPTLRQACMNISKKYEALRTTFDERTEHLYITIHKDLSPTFNVVDLTGKEIEKIRFIVQEFHKKPFNLSKGPLVRWGLFKVKDNEHILVLTSHHAVMDFRSLEIIFEDLGTLYRQKGVGEYKQENDSIVYLEEEDRFLKSQSAKISEEYWQKQLRPPISFVEWPKIYGSNKKNTASSYYFSVKPDLIKSLENVASLCHVSLHAILLTAWAVTIMKFSTQDEIVIGVPASTRTSKTKVSVGCLINILPIRITITPLTTFETLLQNTQRNILEALSHRFLPLPIIVNKVGAPRDAKRNPLYQTIFSLQRSSGSSNFTSLYSFDESKCLEWNNLCLAPWPLPQQEGQIDIGLEIFEAKSTFYAVLRNNKETISKDNLPFFAKRYELLLEQIPENLQTSLSDYSFIPDKEIQNVHTHINIDKLLQPSTDTLVDRIKQAGEKYHSSIALTDGYHQVTYGNLLQTLHSVAKNLSSLGCKKGEKIGVALPPSIGAIEAMAGVLFAGMVYVPLDLRLPAKRLSQIIQAANIKHVIAEKPFTSLPGTAVNTINLDGIKAYSSHKQETTTPTPQDIAYIVFTSGSTGVPKGIEVRHDGVVGMIDATTSKINASQNDVWSWLHASTFDFSVWEIWAPLCNGGKLVVVPEELRARPDLFLELLQKEETTILSQTPTALRLILTSEIDLTQTSIKHIICCGEPLPGETARKFLSTNYMLWNLYGPAEASVFSTALFVDQYAASHEIVPIGTALGHVRVHLMSDALQHVGYNQIGELCISGQGVANGYVDQEEETKNNFISFSSHDNDCTIYRTGDFALWDGEHLQYCGRKDSQVKVRGYRIELGDIEAACTSHEGISSALALVHNNKIYAAITYRETGSQPNEKDIKTYLETKIPNYMVPNIIKIFSSIPINSHGKSDRQKLISIFEKEEETLEQQDLKPFFSDNIQRQVIEIWQKILANYNLTLDSQFFEAGGNSLQLMQVLSKIKEDLCKNLTPADMFQYPTTRRLSQRIHTLLDENIENFQTEKVARRRKSNNELFHRRINARIPRERD